MGYYCGDARCSQFTEVTYCFATPNGAVTSTKQNFGSVNSGRQVAAPFGYLCCVLNEAETTQWGHSMKNHNTALYATVGGIIAFFAVGLIASWDTSSGPERIKTGQEGILEISGQGEVLVATTKENLGKIVHTATVKDDLGIAQMVLAGQAYLVDKGTKVLVIDTTLTASQIRILEGEEIGSSGWVPEEFVKEIK